MLLFLGMGIERERGREKEREKMSQIRELVVWCKDATRRFEAEPGGRRRDQEWRRIDGDRSIIE